MGAYGSAAFCTFCVLLDLPVLGWGDPVPWRGLPTTSLSTRWCAATRQCFGAGLWHSESEVRYRREARHSRINTLGWRSLPRVRGHHLHRCGRHFLAVFWAGACNIPSSLFWLWRRFSQKKGCRCSVFAGQHPPTVMSSSTQRMDDNRSDQGFLLRWRVGVEPASISALTNSSSQRIHRNRKLDQTPGIF